jgi:ribonuclease-3
MLLRKCFTHTSYAHKNNCDDNELLEFFGDSIIEYVVTEYLYKNSAGDEGDLTRERARLVSRDPLLKVVVDMGLDKYMLFGVGQELTVSKTEELFSSLYEALCAGIYIDGGMQAVKTFIKETLIKRYEQDFFGPFKKKKTTAESKSELQELVQKKKLGSISYEVLSKKGPDNLPEFRVAVLLNGTRLAEGRGGSKKQAEANAAERALNGLTGDKIYKLQKSRR